MKPHLLLLKSPGFLFMFLLSLYSIGNQIADCITDVMTATQYYYGSEQFTSICEMKRNGTTDAVQGNKTGLTNTQKEQNNALGIAEPGWFFFTIAFVLIPQVIRYFSSTTEELLRRYFGKIELIHDKNRKVRGMKRVALLIFIRIVMFPFMPFLVILKQITAIPILFRIEQFKKALLPRITFRNQVRQTWSAIKKRFAVIKEKLILFINNDDEDPNSTRVEKRGVQETIDKIIKDQQFKDEVLAEWRQCQTELVDLSETKFYEAFLESGPQSILQLMIFLQLGMDLGLVQFLTILTSFSTLAQSVVVYYNSSLKKDPARRELTVFGQMMVFLCKTPAVISRCLALSVFFTSQTIKVCPIKLCHENCSINLDMRPPLVWKQILK